MYDPSYQAWSDTCQAIHDEYDGSFVEGMPINLQLAARKLEEEKVLAMTDRVLQALAN